MDVIPFVLPADPARLRRLGALLADGRTLVDLQAGHFAMTEAPHPHLRDLDAYHAGGEHAQHVARKVLEWVESQRPPGTTVPVHRVERLDAPATGAHAPHR